jgi:hypothetical protein
VSSGVLADPIDQGALIRLGEGLGEGTGGGSDADDGGGCLEFRPLARGDERWQGFHSGYDPAGTDLDQRTANRPTSVSLPAWVALLTTPCYRVRSANADCLDE